MVDPTHDALMNVVQEGIKGDLRAVLEIGRWRAAVTLTLAGMDTMAYLGLPPERVEVSGSDFIAWSERFIRFDGLLQLTGRDLYGARCGIVHTYGTASRLSRKGDARHVLYKYRRPGPPVELLPGDPEAVIVSVEALADAFFGGVDHFMSSVRLSGVRDQP